MSNITVNNNGGWQVITAGIAVNDGGTWRDIRQVSVNDNGTWRDVFNVWHPQQAITGPSGPGVSVTYFSNGSGSPTTSPPSGTDFNWFYPATTSIGNGYWIHGQVLQGTADVAGGSMGDWIQLSSPITFFTFTAGFNIVRVAIASDNAGANIIFVTDLHLIAV